MKPGLLSNFYKIFDLYLPTNICEIGTHRGQSAVQFIDYLCPRVQFLTYKGYDLFEDVDQQTTIAEHNGKGPGSFDRAFKSLEKRKKVFNNLSFELIKGNTKETLKSPQIFDFAYIDGGHSYETVMHDYSMVSKSTVIVFDDYQIPEVARAVDQITANVEDYKIFMLTDPNRIKRKQVAMLKIINDDILTLKF